MAKPKVDPRQRWTRDAVVQTAAELADRHGYDALSLAMLAQALDIKPPSLYKHVGGLDDVKTAIQAYAAERLNAVMLDAAVGRAGDAAIFAVADAYRAFMKTHPGLQVALSRPSATSHKGKQDVKLEETNRRLLTFAQRLLDPFDLDQKQRIHALRSLRSLIHGFAMLETTGSFEMPYRLDESFRWAVANLVQGLKKKPARTAQTS